jgi:dTMP kinase
MTTSNRPGRFITVEGIDGAGKTTQARMLGSYLQLRGLPVHTTREPGGTPLGERLREELLSSKPLLNPLTETLLMFAARQEHLEQLVRPKLAAGIWVISDRFTDATYAYQGAGRGVDRRHIEALEQLVHSDLQPDLTLYFDLEVGLARSRIEANRSLDRFEQEDIPFFERVRGEYLGRAATFPHRIRVLDASRPQTELSKLVQQAIPTDWFV